MTSALRQRSCPRGAGEDRVKLAMAPHYVLWTDCRAAPPSRLRARASMADERVNRRGWCLRIVAPALCEAVLSNILDAALDVDPTSAVGMEHRAQAILSDGA